MHYSNQTNSSFADYSQSESSVCTSFLRTMNDDLTKVDMDKIDNWLPLNSTYPGILSHETVKAMVPHEKERFLSRL